MKWINFVNKKKMLIKVEELVCSLFDVEISDIHQRNSTKKVSNARSMVWYILHCKYQHSCDAIAKHYSRTRRNVCYMIAKMKFLIEKDRDIHCKYQKILELLM